MRDIRQVMRWMRPGEFTMGSPPEEVVNRYEDETKHKVTLTEGFWLADTACTQELWTAVMGENPSRFHHADELPVENISWNDCQEFLNKVNESYKGLKLRLPTEAQWEYACRAGTDTPFSFGENITTDEVNYNGNNPYSNDPKGKSRKKTVQVKELPANQWGLYQMHGNVWEWCADWYGKYDVADKMNPVGPSSGEFRVLRGGSWADFGRNVRSAYRDWLDPGNRNGGDVGFRFSRGV